MTAAQPMVTEHFLAQIIEGPSSNNCALAAAVVRTKRLDQSGSQVFLRIVKKWRLT